jgi:hypothetical protein
VHRVRWCVCTVCCASDCALRASRVYVSHVCVLTGPFSFRGNGYILTSKRGVWLESEKEANELGGHLAWIDDEEELRFLIDSFVVGSTRNAPLWLGLKRDEATGKFTRWMDGGTKFKSEAGGGAGAGAGAVAELKDTPPSLFTGEVPALPSSLHVIALNYKPSARGPVRVGAVSAEESNFGIIKLPAGVLSGKTLAVWMMHTRAGGHTRCSSPASPDCAQSLA